MIIFLVPLKVWRINELDEGERSNTTVNYALDEGWKDGDKNDDKWWEFVDLQKLILANNMLTIIPPDVAELQALSTLDVGVGN